MQKYVFRHMGALFSSLALTGLIAGTAVFAQTAADSSDYEPPRTEFGHPDLQGIWT